MTEIEISEWWCPQEARWVSCPGPCPDGALHSEKRTRKVQATVPTIDDRGRR